MSGEACCGACAALETQVVATDPLRVLRRLPRALFPHDAPVEFNPGATFDDVYLDNAIFGPVAGRPETLQYALARILAQEGDYARLAIRQAIASQLGLGRRQVVDGTMVGECPRAAGEDMDRLAHQYGVSRPRGFTDCCLWRLVLLLLFKPGPTRWLLGEVAELFTGERPVLLEEPAKLILSWQAAAGGAGDTFRDGTNDPDDGAGFFNDFNSYNSPGGGLSLPNDDAPYGYWFDGGAWDPQPGGVDPLSFFAEGLVIPVGMTLEDALSWVKPAGVAIDYVNLPTPGRGGCYGATQRGGSTEFSVWA